MDLKNIVAEQSSIPAERQRIIYSGRVLKDHETIGTYKIKNGQTVHLIRGAAPQSTPATSSSSPSVTSSTTPNVPTSFSTGGTVGNPLADLTGARYAGFANLPSASMFGPDGGMGSIPNPDELANLLSQPGVREQMNAMLSNPSMIEMLINSNPQLQNMAPMFRSMMGNESFRNMLTNPEAIRSMMQMQQAMNPARTNTFPAPGVAENISETETRASENNTSNSGATSSPSIDPTASLLSQMLGNSNQSANPFADLQQNLQSLSQALGTNRGASESGYENSSADNPFSALLNPEIIQQQTQYLQSLNQAMEASRNATNAADQADNRPPEEKYESQLRQLNELGFYDFDRNVRALRRSGGHVQGAIEALLDNLI